MVGDSLDSDIKGGNSNGFETILVKTGNYKEGKDLSGCQPRHVVDNVQQAV